MDRFFGSTAAIGFVTALIVHALTFAHIDLIDKFPLVWSLHLGIFVVFIPFVFSAKNSLGGTFQLHELTSVIPKWASILLVGTFVYAIANFVLFFFLSEGGVPDVRDGQFILHSHGKLIRRLTEQEYIVQKAYVLRGFSGHWLIFYLAPALYFLLRVRPNPTVNTDAPPAGGAPIT